MHTDAWPSKQEKEGKKKHTILAVLKTTLKKILNETFRKKNWGLSLWYWGWGDLFKHHIKN